MLPRAQRLTTSQFDRAFAHSQTVRHPLVVLKAHRRGDGEAIIRAAFVVPKKQGKATLRNRTRRRLRERFRLISTKNEAANLTSTKNQAISTKNEGNLSGCDLIFLTTPQTHGATTSELDNALREVLRRAGKRIGNDIPVEKSVEEKAAPSSNEESEVASFFVESDVSNAQSAEKPCLPLTILALGLIRFYQRFISPGLPPSCRFEPSCSRYTYATIERFGLWRGGFLGLIRVCKCHPWHVGGLDPVPQIFPSHRSENQNRKFSWPLFGFIKSKK